MNSVAECAAAITQLLQHPRQAKDTAQRGQERVREQFLLPRLLLNEVTLMSTLLLGQPMMQPSESGALRRDPVCGMSLGGTSTPITADVDHQVYAFCSLDCRASFLAALERDTEKPQP